MKKMFTMFCIFACLMFVLAIPAYADKSNGTYNNRSIGNTVPDTGMRADNIDGNNEVSRALTTDGNRNINSTVNTNDYRANAVGDDNNIDWGWLGLLGLIGLAGLRNRNRERT